MAYNRFLIAPFESGLTKDLKPFLIPDDAFKELRNAYVFRGRVQKRFGSSLIASSNPHNNRLRVKIGDTDPAGDLTITLAAGDGYVTKVGQMFSVGDALFTVTQAVGDLLLSDPAIATTATFNTTTGALVLQGTAPDTPVYFYPCLPVMGLLLQEISPDINEEQTVAFDTRFAYRFSDGWERLGTAHWTGDSHHFPWGVNFKGSETVGIVDTLFVVNNRYQDGVKYLQGSTWTTADLDMNYEELGTAIVRSGKILSARCLEVYEGRLLFFNVWQLDHDGTTRRYPQRVWWSAIGSPLSAGAYQAAAKTGAGFLDAPTQQKIITVKTIQNRLIVFCERSTWELVPTRVKENAFIWRQLNSHIGVESAHSVIPFDEGVIGVADTGIISCTGANVSRIDSKIPGDVANFRNMDEGFERVYGIRDFYTEFAYWTFPRVGAPTEFPNQTLLYNYKNGSWSYNDDSFTCFGYFWNQGVFPSWDDIEETWQETELTWDDGSLQKNFRNIAAGNQQGFVSLIAPSVGRNAPSLSITNITQGADWLEFTCIDHNLDTESYILLENIIGPTELNNKIFQVIVLDRNSFALSPQPLSAPYAGGGTVARVTPIEITTKDYNFYLSDGRYAAIDRIDFMIESGSTDITYDCHINTDPRPIRTVAIDQYPYDNTKVFASRNWITTYPQTEGQSIQLSLYQTDDQIKTLSSALSPLSLHAIMFYAKPTRATF